MDKLFDLNIEQVLENWSKADALREIISNALDEQILSNTKPITLFKDGDVWHIRDYGRGVADFMSCHGAALMSCR